MSYFIIYLVISWVVLVANSSPLLYGSVVGNGKLNKVGIIVLGMLLLKISLHINSKLSPCKSCLFSNVFLSFL